MSLLIDGYNLLHVSGVFGTGPSDTPLRASREALLGVLAGRLDEAARRQTTIVFDARHAPPGLPRRVQQMGMTVHFAAEYRDADELLEQLIAEHHAPRALVVVSSDHRVQRAARRRRATAVDSDRWFAELMRPPPESAESGLPPEKLLGTSSPAEVAYWTQRFTERRSEQDAELGQAEPPHPDDSPL